MKIKYEKKVIRHKLKKLKKHKLKNDQHIEKPHKLDLNDLKDI